jgi:hypothetical protein
VAEKHFGWYALNLQIIVEGDCEVLFVKQILAPHLGSFGVFARAIPVHTSSVQRGGMTSFDRAKADIQAALKQDGFVSTMFDLFRLPTTFPGLKTAPTTLSAKLLHLKNALADEIDDWRFIPYLQAHEFEALLFCQPETLDGTVCRALPNCTSQLVALNQIVAAFESPEHINGQPETAPSKRLEKLYRGFRKTIHGVAVLRQTPLPVLRQKCQYFDAWIGKLETLAQSPPPVSSLLI